MFCDKCGKPVADGQRFCPSCGAPVSSGAGTPPPSGPTGPTGPVSGGGAGGDLTMAFRIICGVIGGVFALCAIGGVFSILGSFVSIFTYDIFQGFLNVILDVLTLIPPLVMALVLLAAAIKWDSKLNDTVFLGAALAAVLRLVVLLVCLVLKAIFMRWFTPNFLLILNVLAYVAVAGGLFGLLYAMKCPPVLGKDKDAVKLSVADGVSYLSDALKKKTSETGGSKMDPTNDGYNPNPNPGAPNGGDTTPPPYMIQPKKTDRSLLMLVLLNIVTCGIYGYIFLYGLANDMNDVCAGDGEKTSSLVAFILLGYLTCGIYQIYWYYKLCNRMSANAPRYGLTFQENGTTFLVWYLLGSVLCGIGYFVAMNFVIRNANTLCSAYNQYNGLYGTGR